jgi:hypothetical protein
MADQDVVIEYGSTGFEKVQGELKSIEKAGSDVPNWFRPAHRTLEEVGSKGQGAFRQLSAGVQEASSHLLGFIGHLTRLASIGTVVSGVLGSLGVYAFERWTKSVLMATDSHQKLEASLLGVVKSQGTVKKIVEFSEAYAAKSPMITRDEALETMTQLAFHPAFKPIMEEGDVDTMKRVLDVVQALAKIRPQEGIEGSTLALRQAMSGVWRTMQHQYGIRPEYLAGKAGISMEQFESAPAKSFKALETYVLGLTQPTTNLTNVIKKLRENYHEWLEDLGKTGIYDKVLGYLTKLNEFFKRIGESSQWKSVTQSINSVLEGIANGIANILTKGIDWEKVTDLSGALKAFNQVGRNTIEEVSNAWEANKDWLTSTLEQILGFAATSSIAVAKRLFPAVGKAIADAIQEGMKESPFLTMLLAGSAGAWLGTKFGIPPHIAGPVAMEAVALPTQLKEIDRLSREYDTAMIHIGDSIENFIRRIAGLEVKPPGFKAEEYKGPKPWTIERAAEKAAEARYMDVGIYRPGTLSGIPSKTEAGAAQPPLGLGQQLQLFGEWSKMAGPLAEARGKERFAGPQTTGFLFATGQIPEEEFFKRRQMEKFQGMQEKMLTGIVEAPEGGVAAAGVKAQAYQQLFGISMGRGETGAAETYMEKALEQIRKSFEIKPDQSIKENTTAIIGSTTSVKDSVTTTKELIQAIKQMVESGAVNKKGEEGAAYSGTVKATKESTESIQDEIRYDVERGYTNY